MATRKSFESVARSVDQLIRNNINYRNENMKLASLVYGSNRELFYGINRYTENDATFIRDQVDGVVYFMVGVDRVNSAAKTKG
jgi:hypothetical protein